MSEAFGYAVTEADNPPVQAFLLEQAERCSALMEDGERCEAGALFGGICVEHRLAMETPGGVSLRFDYPVVLINYIYEGEQK